MNKHLATLTLAAVLVARMATAQGTFQAILLGSSEVGPTGSTATGIGTVVLNAAGTQITVDESWTGLTAPATASHIHGPASTSQNAGVLIPFSGVPAATAGSIPEQVFSITPTQVGYLESGQLYMNVHTSTFPGGEIRGQLLAVPEPTTAALLGLGLAAGAWGLRKKRIG
ncbi:MAG TPA: CHRD domain-containing protein [Candidatus Acidoferrum sp.]|jgi:hypothetical protein|nr:CHRD domain-containing protein [Candidatus Acidoferrum sp.]